MQHILNKILHTIKKVFIWFIGFIFLVILLTIGNCFGKTTFSERIENNTIKQTVDQMNKNLPKNMGNMMLNKVELHENRELRYCFTVFDNNLRPTDEEIKIIRKHMVQQVKESPDKYTWDKYKITIAYEYRNKKGECIGLIKIYPKDYQ